MKKITLLIRSFIHGSFPAHRSFSIGGIVGGLFTILLASGLTSSQAQNTWTRKTDFAGTARWSAAGFSIGNKGYIGTGLDYTLIPRKDFWEYDPAANVWTQEADFAGIARYVAVGFSIGNKGYIGTGHTTDSSKNDFWEYDPTANSWTRKADFSGTPRYYAVGFSIDNKGYIGTGTDLFCHSTSDFWEYDPSTNTWTRKADFTGPARSAATGFSIGSKGYLGTGSDLNNIYKKDFWEYNPATNSWTQKLDFGGTGRYGSIGFSISNKGYIGTGHDIDYEGKNDFWEYDPATNKWTQKASFSGTSRDFATGFSIGGKGYVGTGEDPNYKNDFWEFTPEKCKGLTVYADADGDDYGDADKNIFDADCLLPHGYVYDSTDCNDNNASIHPYAVEIAGNGIDDDCDGIVDASLWTRRSSFAGTTRLQAVGFSIGDKGYIGTGSDTSSKKNDFWEYDPSADVWTQKANFKGTARDGAIGFSIDSKGYIGTGRDTSGYTTDFWEYDPSTNKWTQKASFGGTARFVAVGFSIDAKGYAGTGYATDGLKNDFWEYDPSANKWAQKANFKGTARSYAVGFSIGSKGYIGTGYNNGERNDFWQYDPSIDTWTQKATFGGAAREGAAGFGIGNKGYIGTGFDPDFKNDFWEYDAATNRWTQRANFGGTVRELATGFSIGGKGYIGTGYDLNYKNDFWEYIPEPCNGLTIYADNDADGYGDPSNRLFVGDCIVPGGYVYDSTDCNDNNADIHPGVCDGPNGLDDNCDGVIDDGFGTTTFYADADGDKFGNANVTTQACSTPHGYVSDSTDCNDSDASIHPYAIEICGNGVDENCNGLIDEYCCSAPSSGLTASDITTTSATLKWDSVSGVEGYAVRYKIVGATIPAKSFVIATSISISGLLSDTKYVWQVASICGTNSLLYSHWSSIQYFQTGLSRLASESLKNSSFQIYPNPANAIASIHFTIPQSSHVSIKVFDLRGKEIAMLSNNDLQQGDPAYTEVSAGTHSLQFNTNHFAKGVYIVTMITDDAIINEKLIVQ